MNKKNRNNQLIKGTVVYGLGSFGTKILGFIIIPIYTYYISTAELGLYDIIMSTISLLTPIITLQISDAAYKGIVVDYENKNKYIISTIQILIINCLVFLSIVLLINKMYVLPYCLYFCIILVLSRALETLQKLLRGLKRQGLFATSGIIYTIFFLSLNILMLCIFHKGIIGLFQSVVIANIFTIIFILIFEKRLRINLFTRIDKKLIISMFKFSVPLVPNYLNWWIINSSDRYIVLWFLGASATGVLAIAHKFPTMLQSIMGLFNSSWQDFVMAEKEIKDSDNYYSMIFEKYYQIMLSLLTALIPYTKVFILIVMNKDYKVACDFVTFYYLGTVFQGFSSFVGVGYLKNGKTKSAFSSSIYGAIANAVINIILINIIGLQAAAISTFFAFFIIWIIRIYQTKDELKIKLNKIKFISLLIVTIIIGLISIYSNLKINILLCILGTCNVIFINRKEIILTFNYMKKIKYTY